jgi:hypothetical protein
VDSAEVERVANDPAAFFSAEEQKATEQLGHANILISGQTEAGKSTLINASQGGTSSNRKVAKPRRGSQAGAHRPHLDRKVPRGHHPAARREPRARLTPDRDHPQDYCGA